MRLNFVFTEVAAGLRRNLTMTIAMIMTTAISLAFFGAGLLVANQIGDMKTLYLDKLEVSVYLQDDATATQRAAIESQLKTSPEVESFDYLDKAAAFARFKQLFKGNPQLVNQATPDDLPATYLKETTNGRFDHRSHRRQLPGRGHGVRDPDPRGLLGAVVRPVPCDLSPAGGDRRRPRRRAHRIDNRTSGPEIKEKKKGRNRENQVKRTKQYCCLLCQPNHTVQGHNTPYLLHFLIKIDI